MTKNTFFTESQYTHELDLEVNNEVLQRMYADNIDPLDEKELEFVFITDSNKKAERLKKHLTANHPSYTQLEVQYNGECWELRGRTPALQLYLPVINDWNKQLWDEGYQFDCKLDGWVVEV